MTADLLALLVEVVSVSAANRQLKKPIDLPRPKAERKPISERTPEEHDQAMKKGIGVLRGTAKKVHR